MHAASRPDQADAIAIAAGNDGLGEHLARVALAIELATGQRVPSSWTQGAVRAEADQLIASCAPATEAEIAAGRLKHRFRALWRQPVHMKAALLRTILLPSRAGMEQTYGLPTGSPLVWPAYGLRTAQLAARAATDAWRLVRGRAREDW
jgi:hypothetical protein